MGQKRVSGTAAAMLGAIVMAACADANVLDVPPTLVRQHADVPAQEVMLCKVGPAGTTATFSIAGNPAGVGNYLSGSQVTLEAAVLGDLSKCKVVWQSVLVSDPTVALTITETAMTPGTAIDQIFVTPGLPASFTATSVTVNVNFSTGGTVIFKNKVVDIPPPPPAGQGCTPGYWGRPQHLDSWPATGYSPNATFFSVFGVNAYPGFTLLGMINNPGDGAKNQLGRHAVAALLNAAHPDVDYDLTAQEIIDAFVAAWNSGDYETQKNIFAGLNEIGCPLN